MSDGGAQVIVEVVSVLGRTRAGRIVLVVGITYLTLSYVVSQLGRAALVGVGIVLAGLLAIAVSFFLRRRRRRQRASLHQWLSFLGLAIVASATAIFVIVRRRKGATLGPAPSAAEVEQLASGGVER